MRRGEYGKLICLCLVIGEGAALGWVPDLLSAPQASPATMGRTRQVERRRQQPVQQYPLASPYPLEQGQGALLYGFPSSPCPSLTLPPSSAMRPGLLVPRRRWR